MTTLGVKWLNKTYIMSKVFQRPPNKLRTCVIVMNISITKKPIIANGSRVRGAADFGGEY